MFFEVFSRLRALLNRKCYLPYARVLDNTLLRHVFNAVVCPTKAWHVIVVPIGLAKAI